MKTHVSFSEAGKGINTGGSKIWRRHLSQEHGRHLGGGRQRDTSPPRLEGWGTQYQMSPPPRFLNLCVCPPKVLYPYKFRLEGGLKLCIWSCVVWWDTKIVGDITLFSHLSDITCCHRAILTPIESSLGLFYSLIILLSKYVLQIKMRIYLISENY